MPTLRLDDTGDAVKNLQRSLNLLGSMLLIDGDFGRSTEAAVVDARTALGLPPGNDADDELQARLRALPEPSADLTAPGVTFVGREEVSSPAEYRRKFLHPVLPPESSGITIGIGYDLRFVDRAQLDADWGELVAPGLLDRLAAVSGRVGSAQMLAAVRDIEIPLPAAMKAFLSRMMPHHVDKTRTAYPSLDALPAHRRTVLISLVFNRGPSLDPAEDRRREMRRIRDLLAEGRPDDVPAQLESMTRLWIHTGAQGLVDRRRREARLWRDGFAALQLI
jgi:peptidoglycan hydrolase-like protein with peptidoglycan-binding domain